MNSHIQINDNGKKTLFVFYDNEKADYDQAIDAGILKHGLQDENITVICNPFKKG